MANHGKRIAMLAWWGLLSIWLCASATAIELLFFERIHRGTPFGLFLCFVPWIITGLTLWLIQSNGQIWERSTWQHRISVGVAAVTALHIVAFGLLVIVSLSRTMLLA